MWSDSNINYPGFLGKVNLTIITFFPDLYYVYTIQTIKNFKNGIFNLILPG